MQNHGILYLGTLLSSNLKKQEQKCREYARRKNIKITAVFREKNTANEVRKRGVLRGMCTYLFYRSDVRHVIINELKDIARNNAEFWLITKFLGDSKAKIHFVKEPPEADF